MAQSYSRCSKACIEQGSGTGWGTMGCMARGYTVACEHGFRYGIGQCSASLHAYITHGRRSRDKEGGVALITAALL